MAKIPVNTRQDPNKLRKLKEQGINLSKLIEEAIDEVLGTGRCPTCKKKLV